MELFLYFLYLLCQAVFPSIIWALARTENSCWADQLTFLIYQTFIWRLERVTPGPAGFKSVTWSLCVSYYQSPAAQTTVCLSICMEPNPNQRLRSLGWQRQFCPFTSVCQEGQMQPSRFLASDFWRLLWLQVLCPRKIKEKENLSSFRHLWALNQIHPG